MKKKKAPLPKPKEFANPAFAALKGLQATPAEPAPVTCKAPPVRKEAAADDMDLFLLAMAGVEKLGSRPGKPAQERSEAPVKAVVRKIEESEQRLFLEAINGLKLDITFHDELPAEPVPTKPGSCSRMKQLRRGTIRIDYELDLHGLTKDEALEGLNSFIKGAYRRGQQAVLVITGRGNHSPDEPVLKSAVDSWLRKEGKEMVVEFFSAPRQLGGEGAIVVFLRQGQETRQVPG